MNIIKSLMKSPKTSSISKTKAYSVFSVHRLDYPT